MLSFGFRIFCWYRGFCHRTGSDLLLFVFILVDDGSQYRFGGEITFRANLEKKISEMKSKASGILVMSSKVIIIDPKKKLSLLII